MAGSRGYVNGHYLPHRFVALVYTSATVALVVCVVVVSNVLQLVPPLFTSEIFQARIYLWRRMQDRSGVLPNTKLPKLLLWLDIVSL